MSDDADHPNYFALPVASTSLSQLIIYGVEVPMHTKKFAIATLGLSLLTLLLAFAVVVAFVILGFPRDDIMITIAVFCFLLQNAVWLLAMSMLLGRYLTKLVKPIALLLLLGGLANLTVSILAVVNFFTELPSGGGPLVIGVICFGFMFICIGLARLLLQLKPNTTPK